MRLRNEQGWRETETTVEQRGAKWIEAQEEGCLLTNGASSMMLTLIRDVQCERTRWRCDAHRSTFLSACLGVTGQQSGFPLSNRTDFFTFYSSLDHGFHFIRRGNGEPWIARSCSVRRGHYWSSIDQDLYHLR